MVLVIARLGTSGPIDDLSSRFAILVHNLYHMFCKQVYILLENNLLLLLLLLQTKKIEKYGPILQLKRVIKLSETLWYRFLMVAQSSGIDQNLLPKKPSYNKKKLGQMNENTA